MPRGVRAVKAAPIEQIPQYRILDGKGAWLEDETLHEQGTIIEYLGVPNENMEPLNEAARARMNTYLIELDDGARARAADDGRHYRGRVRDLGDQVGDAVAARPKEQKMVMPKSNLDAPVRPDMVPISKRHRADAGKVVSASQPKPKGKQTPIPIAQQGTHYDLDSATEAGIS